MISSLDWYVKAQLVSSTQNFSPFHDAGKKRIEKITNHKSFISFMLIRIIDIFLLLLVGTPCWLLPCSLCARQRGGIAGGEKIFRTECVSVSNLMINKYAITMAMKSSITYDACCLCHLIVTDVLFRLSLIFYLVPHESLLISVNSYEHLACACNIQLCTLMRAISYIYNFNVQTIVAVEW